MSRDVGDPVAHGFADRVFQRAAAVGDADHLGAEQPHAEDVEPLAAHVLLAHVDDASKPNSAQTVAVATPCWPAPVSAMMRCLPMRLASSAWPSAVVDLVRAGVEQVFALEVDVRAAQSLAEPPGEIERRGPAGVVLEQIRRVRPETRDPGARRYTPAPVPRAAPSALPARSGRRKGRSARRRPVEKRS